MSRDWNSLEFWIKLIAVGIFLCSISACGGSQATPDLSRIVLISIDTCRIDRIGCYGSELDTTPNIDRISRDGIRFEHARSPVPLTLPAHSTLMTGLLPPEHGVHNNLGFRLGDDSVTVAEILTNNGWNTGAVVSAFVLDSNFGIAQGFASYDDRLGDKRKPTGVAERQAEDSTSIAIDWLEDSAGKQSFLFLHLFDPHRTYDPPSPWSERFRGHPYEGEIAYADYWIGQLVQKLHELDAYRSSLIIITSDHGEMLGEHGEQTHGYTLYESALRVPLIIKPPGRGSWSGQTIAMPVGLEDVTPTILGFADLPDSPNMPGINLQRYWDSTMTPPPDDRFFFSETIVPSFYKANPLRAAFKKNWKLIYDVQSELYDLDQDPAESKNLFKSDIEVAEDLKIGIQNLLESSISSETVALSETDRAQLQALGYVSAEVDHEALGFSINPDLPPAIDLISIHNNNSRVYPLITQGRLKEARQLCEEMIKIAPDMIDPHLNLSEIAAMQGRLGEAELHLLKALEIEPERYEAINNLGLVYSQSGRQNEARRLFERAIALDSQRPQALSNLGALLFETGETEAAINTYRQVLEIDSEHVECLYGLGLALQESGKNSESEQTFRTALQIDPGQPDVSVALAGQLGDNGRWNEVEPVVFSALKRAPENTDLLRIAALATHRNGNNQQSAMLYDRALEFSPTDSQLWHEAAVASWESGNVDSAVDRWRRALQFNPGHIEALNGLAWNLATSADSAHRDPTEAIALARRACRLTGFESPSYLDTLAAAYAANGDYGLAIETAEKAVGLASRNSSTALVQEISARLVDYQQLHEDSSQSTTGG